MNIQKEFHEFIKSLMSLEQEGDDVMKVKVMPTMEIALKKSMLNEENGIQFIKYMSQIRNIHKGLSYIQMAGCEPFAMTQQQAIICQGIGKAFGVWQLIPVDMAGGESMMEMMISADPIGMQPMNTGLDPRGGLNIQDRTIKGTEVDVRNDGNEKEGEKKVEEEEGKEIGG